MNESPLIWPGEEEEDEEGEREDEEDPRGANAVGGRGLGHHVDKRSKSDVVADAPRGGEAGNEVGPTMAVGGGLGALLGAYGSDSD